MNTTATRVITAAIVGALALSCSTLSIAADKGDVPQIVVKYGDLNPSNTQGALALYSRIVAAATEVCKPLDMHSRDLGTQSRAKACVRKATADAVTKVGQPGLFAVYNAKSHQPLPIIVAAAQTR
jgi:UrcA family protein